MKPRLTIRAIPVPRHDAEQSFSAALDLLAEGLAALVIEEARAEVAARLGVAPKSIDREGGLTADDLAFLDAPTALDGAA